MENTAEFTEILRLLKKYGDDSLSYFHLQANRQYFFSPDHNSFLSYRVYNKVALVSGDPVGPDQDKMKLIQSFVHYCQAWHLKVCFIGVSEEFKKNIDPHDFKVKRIGEEAAITLNIFDRSKLKKRVRRAVKHVEQYGIEIFYFTPQTLPAFLSKQLEKISGEWLTRKGKKEKGFSMTLKRIPNLNDADCLISIAIKGQRVIGFATFIPIYKNQGYSLDLIRKKLEAPNGLNEFLIIKTLEYLKSKHIKLVTLNFAAFVFSFPSANKIKVLASKTLAWFFRCNSLYSFNNKFRPIWISRYAFFSNYIDLPASIMAIIRAERY